MDPDRESTERSGAGSPSAAGGRGAMLAILVLAAVLRVLYQSGRSFTADDAGTLHYLAYDYGYLLTHFDIWLTMNYYMVGLKALGDVFGDSPWVLVAPCLLSGLATIPLAARLARRYFDERFALAVAFLVAVNPWMVEYSVALRSYMPLVCLSLATLLAHLAWEDAPGLRRGAICASLAGLAMIVHPNAFYPLGFVGVLFLLGLRERRAQAATWLGPMALAAALVVALYLPLREGMASYRADWTVPAPSEWGYLPVLARRYFGPGWSAVPALALGAFGFLSAFRQRRPVARLALGVLVPMCLASLLGVATILGAWARFLSPVLPLLIVLVVQGIAALVPHSRNGARALVLLVALSWTPLLVHLQRTKEANPYHLAAEHLEALEPGRAEVFSFDLATRRFLVPYLGDEPFGPLRAWLQRGGLRERPRLIVLAQGVPLATERAVESFGDIQVVTYEADTSGAILEELRGDLERTLAAHPTDPEYLDLHGALISVLMALGREDELVPVVVRYYEAFIRTQRLRDVPLQVLEARDTISNHPLIRRILGQGESEEG